MNVRQRYAVGHALCKGVDVLAIAEKLLENSKIPVQAYRYEVGLVLPPGLELHDLATADVIYVWHWDNEDSLVLLGWERPATLKSKVKEEAESSGGAPAKLDRLPARPMNELIDLSPNTAHMNQKLENPFSPGDRVVKAEDKDPSVAVVEVMPPEKNVGA